MTFTASFSKTGSSPSSMVSSLPSTIGVIAVSSPSTALVLFLLVLERRAVKVPAEARRASTVRLAVIFFLLVIIALVLSTRCTSLVVLFCFLCFLYSTDNMICFK